MKKAASSNAPPKAQRLRLLLAAPLLLWAGHAYTAPLTLVDSLALAYENDPSVPPSIALRETERELGEQERAGLRPTVSAQGSYNYSYSDSKFAFGQSRDEYPAWSAGLEARQALFRLDWSARGERADAQEALADAGMEQRRVNLYGRVAERYIGVLIAEDALRQAQAEADAVRESMQDTRKRYEVDLVPGTDLKEAQARDDLAQAQLLSAQQEVESSRDVLAETVGRRDFDLPQMPDAVVFGPVVPAEVDAWIDAATENNPALVIARRDAQIAKTQVRSRRADAMPQVDLVASVSRNDSTEYVLGQRQDDASIGVELNVPIYAGGYNDSRVREAEANLRRAESAAQLLASETEREVRVLFRSLKTNYIQVRAYERARESAALAQTATKAGYDAGTRTITDVLDAQSRVVQASRNLNQTRYDLLLNMLQLRQYTGQIDETFFAAVDALFTQTPAQP